MSKKYLISYLIIVVATALIGYVTVARNLSQSPLRLTPVAQGAATTTPSPTAQPRPSKSTNNEGPLPLPVTTHTEPASAGTQAPNIILMVGSSTYRFYAVPGTTVYDAMIALKAAGTIVFTGENYPTLGFFVESINGTKNTGGYYWFLYVNGASSDTGISQTHLSPGDTVEWRYKKQY